MRLQNPEQFITSEEVDQIEEPEQAFHLEDKAGLLDLQKYLMALSAEEDSALSANLNMDDVTWPEEGKVVLKKFRLDYKDLLVKLSEVIGQDDAVSDGDADDIKEMYDDFTTAQSAFIEYQEAYLADDAHQDDTSVKDSEVVPATPEVGDANASTEAAEDLADYKDDVLQWVSDNKISYFGEDADAGYADFAQSIETATTPQEVERIFNSFNPDTAKAAFNEKPMDVEPVVLQNPDELDAASMASAEAAEDFYTYKEQITAELVEFLKEQQFEGIKSRLEKSIDQASTKTEVDRIRHNILHDPAWGEPISLVNPEPAEEFSVYKGRMKERLVAVLEGRGLTPDQINEFLDNSYKYAKNRTDLDRIVHNIENDPMAQIEEVVLPEPVAEGDVPLESLAKTKEAETVSSPETAPSETAEQLPTLEEQFVLTQTAAENLATKTEQACTSLTQKFPRVRRSVEVVDQINRLQRLNQMAEDMLEKITELQNSHEDTLVKLQNLRSYEKTAKKSQAGLQEWLQDVDLRQTEPDAEVLPEASTLPTEAEVASYTERLKNPFYVAEERQTATMLLQYYYEAVAAGKSTGEIQAAFKNFVDNVEELDSHPSPDHLAERIARIEERVEAIKSYEPELIVSIQTMKEQFEQAANLPEPDEVSMLSRYKLIEKMALDTEHLWFTVCGMRLPKAGPEGVFGARSFREGLVLARDRHKDLVGHPEKQALVDEIIGKLWRVPDTGLSEELQAEITRLAHLVDTPGGVVGNLARTETPSEESEPTASEDSGEASAASFQLTPVMRVSEEDAAASSAESDIPWADEPELMESVWLSADSDSRRIGRLPIDDDDQAGGAIPISSVSTEPVISAANTKSVEDGSEPVPVEQPLNADVTPPTLSRQERINQKGHVATYASVEQLQLIRKLDQESPDNIEGSLNKEIKSEISRIEQKGAQLGWFSSMINEPSGSVFDALKEKRVSEVADLFDNFSAANRDELLQTHKISYENLLPWKDEFDDLQKLIVDRFATNPETLTFGQLVTQANIARMINLESGT